MSDTDTHTQAGGRRVNGLRIALASALTLLALLALAPAASADLTFASRGTGAGQIEEPKGIAVDRSDGTLYVADYENNRIDVFDSAGNFLRAFGWGVADGTSAKLQSCTATCFKGIAGSGSGQLKEPTKVAVDNDPSSPAYRDVYVLDKNMRVQRFSPAGGFVLMFGGEVNKTTHGDVCPVAPGDVCGVGLEGSAPGRFNEFDDPVAIGPGGVVYVADSRGPEPKFTGRIEKFEPTGSFIGQLVLFEGVNRDVRFLVVDSSGNFYASIGRLEPVVQKYDPSGTLLYTLGEDVAESSGLALDAADTLFADQREVALRAGLGSYRLVTEYDPSGNILRRGYRPSEQFWRSGIAFFHTAAGDIFGGEGNGGENAVARIRQVALPPPGPVIAPGPVKASPVRSRKATLGAEVNPEGKATSFHYDYVDEQGFEESGFAGAEQTPDTAIGADFKLHLASQDVALEPETVYHFRLIVENEDGTRTREGESFKTLPPLQIGANWATAVGTDAATLHAEVNPLESPASGYFEYVDDASFQESGFAEAHQAPDVAGGASALDFGSGTEAVSLSATLYPLAPGTTYHYRLHVEDPFLILDGPEQTFTTFIAKPVEACPANEAFRGGASAPLPDCRAYEMVSPLDKNNGDVFVLKESSTVLPAVLNQSSVSGSRLAYGTYRAFGDAKSGALTSSYIATRGEGGWASHGISPPRGRLFFTGVIPSYDTEFKVFSPDLCEMWLRTVSEPQLAPGAIAGYPNLYRSQDSECGGLSYEALTTAAWPNVLSGDENMGNQLELQGVSADGGKAIYIAPDNLVGSGAPDLKGKGFTQLYISATGSTPVFACILPNGKALEASCSGGMNGGLTGKNRTAKVQGAISADGSRVFWTASDSGPGKLYMREHAEQGPVEGECTEEGIACTIAVSKAAETKSGASKSQFIAASPDGNRAIFMAKGTGLPGTLAYVEDLYEYDVETQTTRLIAHEAASGAGGEPGLLGVSKDVSHVYFVSVQAMGGENSEGDEAQEGEPNLYLDDGSGVRFIATLSDKDKRRFPSPIGRAPSDNLARVSPDGLHAAFMSSAPLTGYDNTDANSGEADDEVFLYDAAANGGEGKLICASCNPSGARPAGANVGFNGENLLPVPTFWAAGQIPVFENTLYAARVLSDDGSRLFFESSDALVARDGNGKEDVYEWEAVGTGGCDQGDATFSKQNEGCVDLISSGQSERSSSFVDASPSGDDVFFTTLSGLLPQDYGLVDIYDARVGGGYPPPPPLPPACEGDACQSPAPPPNDPTAASAGFKGPGNARPSTPARCGKGKARRKGRCVAKKQHKRAKRAENRANHHRGAAR